MLKKIVNGFEKFKPMDVPKYAKSLVNGWEWIERYTKQTFLTWLMGVLCWPLTKWNEWNSRRGIK